MCGSFYNTYHKRNEEHPEMFLSGVDARDTSKATKIYSLLQGSYSPLTGELSLIFLQQNSRKTACLWDWGIMDAYTMIVWQIQVIITDGDKTISSESNNLSNVEYMSHKFKSVSSWVESSGLDETEQFNNSPRQI